MIKGPTIYALEGIPSTIRPEDVQRALAALKQDRSPLGRRDYAIWMLLTTYGLRGGEIKALQLSDIDWRHERLRIRHGKTGAYSELPLLRAAGECATRLPAPRAASDDGTRRVPAGPGALPAAASRLARCREPTAGGRRRGADRQAGTARLAARPSGESAARRRVTQGDRRCARSPLRAIHAAYLKLATEDLRSVALDLPARVAP